MFELDSLNEFDKDILLINESIVTVQAMVDQANSLVAESIISTGANIIVKIFKFIVNILKSIHKFLDIFFGKKESSGISSGGGGSTSAPQTPAMVELDSLINSSKIQEYKMKNYDAELHILMAQEMLDNIKTASAAKRVAEKDLYEELSKFKRDVKALGNIPIGSPKFIQTHNMLLRNSEPYAKYWNIINSNKTAYTKCIDKTYTEVFESTNGPLNKSISLTFPKNIIDLPLVQDILSTLDNIITNTYKGFKATKNQTDIIYKVDPDATKLLRIHDKLKTVFKDPNMIYSINMGKVTASSILNINKDPGTIYSNLIQAPLTINKESFIKNIMDKKYTDIVYDSISSMGGTINGYNLTQHAEDIKREINKHIGKYNEMIAGLDKSQISEGRDLRDVLVSCMNLLVTQYSIFLIMRTIIDKQLTPLVMSAGDAVIYSTLKATLDVDTHKIILEKYSSSGV